MIEEQVQEETTKVQKEIAFFEQESKDKMEALSDLKAKLGKV